MTAHPRPVIEECTARDAYAAPGRVRISAIDEPAKKDRTLAAPGRVRISAIDEPAKKDWTLP